MLMEVLSEVSSRPKNSSECLHGFLHIPLFSVNLYHLFVMRCLTMSSFPNRQLMSDRSVISRFILKFSASLFTVVCALAYLSTTGFVISSLTPSESWAQDYSGDVQSLNDSELNIMADLIASLADEKKKALKEAKEELERRKARLLRLEENVLRRYKALRMLQEELSSAMKRNKNDEDAPQEDSATSAERKVARAQEIRKLAKSFESMKPAAAAQVIEVMDDALVVDVLRVVNPRKSGKILGALEPKTAARVSELMTNMRRRK